MNWVYLLAAALLSLIYLMLVFIPLEKLFPANKTQKTFRPHWLLDLCFFLGQYLLWNGLVLGLLTQFGGWLHKILPIPFYEQVAAQPWILQVFEVIVLSDLIIYWGHRLQHSTAFLWRFHKVHHSAQHLDWLAAHREHPLDTIYTVGLINLPAFILGFPLQTIAALIAFRGIWAIYIHSNVRLPIGWLRLLIGAPELHHWHHHISRHAGNYANISPIMDKLFGTYQNPGHEPEAIGIEEPVPQNYLGQLIEPLLPRRLAAAILRKKRKHLKKAEV